MKTRTLIFICISLVVASVILMSASCDNGGSNNYIMYEDTKYPVEECSSDIDDPGFFGESYQYGIYAYSSGVDLVEETGTGNMFYFTLYAPSDPVVPGTYTGAPFGSPNYEDPNTFATFEIFLNYGLPGAESFVAVSGTVTLSAYDAAGGTLSCEFDVTLDNGKTATGMYSGSYVDLPW